MIDFEDALTDELEGFFITKAELNPQWTKLREEWETLIAPYAVPTFAHDPTINTDHGIMLGPNKPGRQPPAFLLDAYLKWRLVHQDYVNTVAYHAFPSFLGIWEDKLIEEKRRYIVTYNKLFTGSAPSSTTREEREAAAAPAEVARTPEYGSPPNKNSSNLFGDINLNLGTFAVLGLAGFLAYQIFFRVREGRESSRRK
jgi:hypothetical protein